MKKLLLAALVATSASAEYKSEFKTTERTSIVQVNFMTNEEINEEWSKEYKGYVLAYTKFDGNTCVIKTPHIKDWNDLGNTEILGHELSHCLGARHPDDAKVEKKEVEDEEQSSDI